MSLLLALAAPAGAFCGVYVAGADESVTNEGSRVVLTWQSGWTTLTVASDAKGGGGEFGLVIPVPGSLAVEDVHTVDSAAVDRLDAYSAPRLVELGCETIETYVPGASESWTEGGGCGGVPVTHTATGPGATEVEVGLSSADRASVSTSATVTVGDYTATVVDASNALGLQGWLAENGFVVPDGADAVLADYLHEGSAFLALRVAADRDPEAESWLTPVQLSYPSAGPSLPIRLGTTSAVGVQDLLVFVLTDVSVGEVGIANYPEVSLDDECLFRSEEDFGDWVEDGFATATGLVSGEVPDVPAVAWAQEYTWLGGKCDPCSDAGQLDDADVAPFGWEGSAEGLQLTRLHVRYDPRAVDADLALYTSASWDRNQLRYVRWAEELEGSFPVCGEGWAEDPGSCPEPEAEPSDTGDAPASSTQAPPAGGGCCAGVALDGVVLLGLWARRRGRRSVRPPDPTRTPPATPASSSPPPRRRRTRRG